MLNIKKTQEIVWNIDRKNQPGIFQLIATKQGKRIEKVSIALIDSEHKKESIKFEMLPAEFNNYFYLISSFKDLIDNPENLGLDDTADDMDSEDDLFEDPIPEPLNLDGSIIDTTSYSGSEAPSVNIREPTANEIDEGLASLNDLENNDDELLSELEELDSMDDEEFEKFDRAEMEKLDEDTFSSIESLDKIMDEVQEPTSQLPKPSIPSSTSLPSTEFNQKFITPDSDLGSSESQKGEKEKNNAELPKELDPSEWDPW